MADNFTFELVSPEELLASGDAQIVTLPGTEGDMGVLAGHAPVMTSLRPGLVTANLTEGGETSYFVRGGFADISPAGVTILAEFAVPQKDLTREMFEEQKRIAQEDYDKHHAAGDEAKAANARSYLDQLNHMEPSILPA
ncbi:MAG: F0F1 ATP synthase subunit epsilon [Ahrensia sp.]|nr:F0F1 ATP synthase subunit epsilon [Ahrensia sp.]